MAFTESSMRAFVTLMEMLNDRGVDTERLESLDDDELVNRLTSESLEGFVVNDNIRIVFSTQNKPNTDILRKLVGTEDDDGAADVAAAGAGGVSKRPQNQIIIVVREPPQSSQLKAVASFKKTQVQFFTLKELQFNISKHHLVPKHSIVQEADVPGLLADFMVKSKSQFPHILKTDPMARYLNAMPGDLVKIVRPSPSAGEYVSYRHCA